jgi:hypothetical protein
MEWSLDGPLPKLCPVIPTSNQERQRGRETMFRLIAIDFSQKSPHFSLLSLTSPCEHSEREVTSPSNLKVVGALDNYSLVFVIFINFFRQLID